jgi:hypothetical protein
MMGYGSINISFDAQQNNHLHPTILASLESQGVLAVPYAILDD